MDFESLIKRISTKLKGLIYKLPNHGGAFDKDDLYEEALSYLWAEHQAERLLEKTDSYILQSCYFHLQNHIRKTRSKMQFVSMNTPVNEKGQELQDMLQPEEVEPEEEGPDIDTLMEQVFNTDLDRKEKEIAFFYLQGWTTREIGERLGISHVSVVKLEDKIRNKCKKVKNSL